ncbi:MAG: ATP-binding cassette domain-containing protein [Holophagales bacterium]|nr:ATP-binding cassette domain-containing protein [Holophagales bacterium]
MSAPPLVSVEGLSRTWGDRLALDRVTFDVAAGELFALLGPNGGGKTTLFKLLATLIPPSEGTFRVDGLSPDGSLREFRRRLGVVFQSPSLDRKLTVLENLLVHGAILGLGGHALRSRAGELLSRMGVDDRARDLVETLSGGLARRVEIAKALLGAPKVLLLDEPSTGLDPLARRSLRALLAELARAGTTVLLTTHLFDEAEAAGRIGILDRGRLVALGSPADLKREVGGDVLVLVTESNDLATALSAEIAAFLGPDPAPAPGSHPGPHPGRVTALGPTVRIERPDGPALVPALAASFAGRFRSLTLGAPSLEDVFVDRTGHPFEDAPTDERRAA